MAVAQLYLSPPEMSSYSLSAGVTRLPAQTRNEPLLGCKRAGDHKSLPFQYCTPQARPVTLPCKSNLTFLTSQRQPWSGAAAVGTGSPLSAQRDW